MEYKQMMEKRISLCAAVFIAVLTFSLYFQVRNFDFINYDDDQYITDNENVQGGLNLKSLKWAFTESYAANWHPVTWISHIIDYSFFKGNAGYYHLENLFFHILNSILLLFLLIKLTNNFWCSFFAAVFFAIHPIHTESVAWIAERKDLLSTLFGFLSMFFYIDYAKKGGAKYYSITLIFFMLSLMSKAMFVTLPFVFLLLDFWPLKRFSSLKDFFPLILEKIPFFVCSSISSSIIFFAQIEGKAMQPVSALPMNLRIANIFYSYGKYTLKILIPYDLVIMTQHINSKLGHHKFVFETIAKTMASVLFLISVSYVCIKKIKEKPYMFVGWFWFLGTLVPVIGLVQVGSQGMADRYTYFPSVGFSIFFIWFLSDIFTKLKKGKILFYLGCAVIFIFSILTYRQVGFWQNSITLFERAIKVLETGKKGFFVNPVAHNNLAVAYVQKGDLNSAWGHFWTVYYGNNEDLQAIYNIAYIATQRGEYQTAEDFYRKAISLDKNFASSYNGLGAVLLRKGKYQDALFNLQKAFQLEPSDISFCLNIGSALANIGKYEEAHKFFKHALSMDPTNAIAKDSYRRIVALMGNK